MALSKDEQARADEWAAQAETERENEQLRARVAELERQVGDVASILQVQVTEPLGRIVQEVVRRMTLAETQVRTITPQRDAAEQRAASLQAEVERLGMELEKREREVERVVEYNASMGAELKAANDESRRAQDERDDARNKAAEEHVLRQDAEQALAESERKRGELMTGSVTYERLREGCRKLIGYGKDVSNASRALYHHLTGENLD